MKKLMFSRVRRFLRSDSEGGALVEMAVTLPLIMLIMTGIFSFSMALYQKLQLAEAVAAAGRELAIDRGSHDPCADITSAIDNGAPGLNQTTLNNGIVITINGITEPSGSCPGSGTTGSNTDLENAKGLNVQIQVTYPTTLSVVNVWGSGSGGFSSLNLISQVTEVVQ